MIGQDEFDAAVVRYRPELRAYCYRMLGSLHDAEDALQEALLGAWRGLAGFEGRASLRSWLYRIATNACLRVVAARPRRMLPHEAAPAASGVDVEPFVEGPMWLEPYPSEAESSDAQANDAQAAFERRESLELAFVAALQHLPATQRAVLVLRDVLGFSAAEVAEQLETSVASVNSALQRAKDTVERKVPPMSQQATLRQLGVAGERALVDAFVNAWGRGDVDAIVALLARDATFTMPPIPTWFDGPAAIARFLRERVFATPWRLEPMRANGGQLAFACYQGPAFGVGALQVVSLEGASIKQITGFLDPAVHARFSLPKLRRDR